jgi:O-antigen/teichoic acid export membrane protein
MVFHLDRILRLPSGRVPEARLMFGLMIATFAVGLPAAPFGVGLFVRQRFVAVSLIGLASEILRLILLAVLLIVVSPSVLWVVVSSSVAQIFRLAASTAMSLRVFPVLRFRRSAFSWSTAREIVSFGGWISVASAGGMIYRAADPIILNWLASPVHVVAFSLGALVERHIRSLVRAAVSPVMPALVAMHARGKTDQIQRAFCRLGRYSVWFSGLFALPFVLFRHEFFTLYLAEKSAIYVDAAAVALLLLAQLPLIHSVANGLDKVAFAVGRVRAYVLLTVVSQMINLALTLFFLGVCHYGAVGSALATYSVSLGVFVLGYLPLSLRLTGVSLSDYVTHCLVPGAMPILPVVAIGLAVRALVLPATWLSLGTCAFGCIVAYLVAVCLVALWGDDRGDVLRLFSSLKRGFRSWKSCSFPFAPIVASTETDSEQREMRSDSHD